MVLNAHECTPLAGELSQTRLATEAELAGPLKEAGSGVSLVYSATDKS